MKKPFNITLFLPLILIIAAVARYWGIGFGLPNTQCRPDESMIASIVHSPLRDFHPGNFIYPSLYKYIVLCVYGLYFVIGSLAGRFASYGDLLKEYISNPEYFYLISRCISALMGTATVFLVYKITFKMFDRKSALISAVFLSLAYLHVRDSHFGTCDVPVTFFIMTSVLCIVKSREDKKISSYLLAGLFAGLAAATKYIGILLFVPMWVSHILSAAKRKDSEGAAYFDKKIIIFTLALPAGFLLGTPYALLDLNNFAKDILFQAQALEQWKTISIGVGWWYNLRFNLLYGLGFDLLLASLLGVAMIAKRETEKALVLCSFPISYYILIGSGNTAFSRYMVPVVPFLCITAAVFAAHIIDVAGRYCKPSMRAILAFLIVCFIILPSMRNVIMFDILLDKKDNRLVAAEWMENNLDKYGYRVHIGSLWGRARLRPEEIILSRANSRFENSASSVISKYPAYGKYLRMKKEILADGNIKDIKEGYYDTVASLLTNEKTGLPEYVILEKSPLKYYGSVPVRDQKLLEKKYALIKDFEVIDVDNDANLFDQFDAFYVPFTGFRDIQRPGPNLYIFKKRD